MHREVVATCGGTDCFCSRAISMVLFLRVGSWIWYLNNERRTYPLVERLLTIKRNPGTVILSIGHLEGTGFEPFI